MWHSFEEQPKVMQIISRDYSPWQWQLEYDYFPRYFLFRERGATPFDSDPILKEIFVELEHIIENVIGYDRIQSKQMQMYKGTPKKWQILEDNLYDSDQIVKLQMAARAPMPEELDYYKEKHDKPMQLPITNQNVYAWRDEPGAAETGADFDPKFIEYDRERRKNYYLERYEKPKELAAPS